MPQPRLLSCPEAARSDHARVTRLVEDNLQLVRSLVAHRMRSLPAHVDRDDLMSAGITALVVSAQSFDPTRAVPFTQFAKIRIAGALVDELRSTDWATRSVRCRARELEAATSQLVVTLGRAPSREEIAEAMHMTPQGVDLLRSDLVRARVLSLQDRNTEPAGYLPADDADGPESLILLREKLGYLYDAIAELPDRMRLIVIAYFFHQRQMCDIAVELDITQSRVSQICSEAINLLRDGMNSQLDPSAIKNQFESGRSAANRKGYCNSIATRSSLSARLALTTVRGDLLSSPLEAMKLEHARSA
ncbi:MAG: polymerase sigma 70 [Pseudonocardiales bacterium]|nr:polymerase sigma 70 [Pseudonocardiales bacterium]